MAEYDFQYSEEVTNYFNSYGNCHVDYYYYYSQWVRALTVPMHLGIIKGALYTPQSDINSVQPCPFTKVPDGPQT
jgi:hypothetical protein